MLDLVLNNSTQNKTYKKEFFVKIIKKSLESGGLKFKKIELSINLIGEEKIAQLNKKYRNKTGPTDVLSFPLNNRVDKKSANNGILSLGDIFICVPIAIKRAQEEGVSLNYKMTFLTIHGFLHLLGYDHEKSTKEEMRMFSLQDKILGRLKNNG